VTFLNDFKVYGLFTSFGRKREQIPQKYLQHHYEWTLGSYLEGWRLLQALEVNPNT
jgi:hypothetical protein